MKRIGSLFALTVLVGACTATPPTPEPAAAPAAATPHANLAQLMQAIPFPASNIIFDAQSTDPGATKEPGERGAGATADFASVYGGWMGVENAAIALQETANLLIIPGRMCDNGKPAPVEQEDYRRFTQQLVDAGAAALKAAQAKDLDAIVDVSGTVTEACAACHDVYRDKEDPADRCTVPAGN